VHLCMAVRGKLKKMSDVSDDSYLYAVSAAAASDALTVGL